MRELIDKFIVTEEHLKLLNKLHVYRSRRLEYPFSMPEINTSRPFGNRDIYQDMAEILGYPEAVEGKFPKETIEKMKLLLQDLVYVLQICLCTQSFEPGEYYRESACDQLGWTKINISDLKGSRTPIS